MEKRFEHALQLGSRKQHSKRILIVDDEGIQRLLSEILSMVGYEVVSASNGNKGLNLFLRSSFDLVLTDFPTSGIAGFNLALQIKDRSPNTPVVMITGQETQGVMEKIKGRCVFSPVSKKMPPFQLSV